MDKICVQWPRFGPYHIARLEVLASFLGNRDVDLIGLETAGSDDTYAWKQTGNTAAFDRIQVFPGATFERISPQNMHDGTLDALDRTQPDAVAISAYSFPDARACLSWCRTNRRVAVVMADVIEASAPRTFWRERVKSLLLRQFDAAFVSGTRTTAYFEMLGFPTEYIVSGLDAVDNDYFATASSAAAASPETGSPLPGLDASTPFFLASGRFIVKKNLPFLLRAYDRYRRRVKDPWRLVLLGDGPLRPDLERLIAEFGVNEVTLAGFRQIDEIPAYYGLASAFVHAAANEPWGLVLNEAMASGLPVLVSTSVGCAPDLVQDGVNGFIFDPTDEAGLAVILERVSSGEVDLVEMGKASRRIIAGWDLEHFCRQLWAAVCAGTQRSDRGMDPRVTAFLWMLRKLSSRASSFHTVEA